VVAGMRLRRLALLLSKLSPPIPNPRADLEQYTTPAELALRAALRAITIGGPTASYADLGAGTCRLSLALALLGAGRVAAVEFDERLCSICLSAIVDSGYEGVIQPICSHIDSGHGPLSPSRVEVIVMNPPHGVQRRGADREFLEYAFKLKPHTIIAILKSGNLDFHKRLASLWGYRTRLLWVDTIEIPASMPHHRSRIRRVKVDVIEFAKR